MGLVGKYRDLHTTFLQLFQQLGDSFIGLHLIHTVRLEDLPVSGIGCLKMGKFRIATLDQCPLYQIGGTVSHKIFIILYREGAIAEFCHSLVSAVFHAHDRIG